MEDGSKKSDHSAEVAAAVPKVRAQAASGDLNGAIEQLLALEKVTRLHNDVSSLQVVVEEFVEILHNAKQYQLLIEHVTLLCKRRAQKSQAIGKVVSKAMTYLDGCPTEAIRVQLIEALRAVADGKIFLEKERAQLTQMLSRIKEKNGLIAEAADILQEVHVETYGAMTRLEKVEFILEQVRLTLAKKDYVRSNILAKKILRRWLEETGFEAVKIKFYQLMIEYDTHENNTLELCRHWQAILQTRLNEYNLNKQNHNPVQDQDWINALQHACIFSILAAHSNLQHDMLHLLAQEKFLEKIPEYFQLMKLFTTHEIVPYPLPQQASIQIHQIFKHPIRGAGWLEHLHTRTTEHNIRVVAKHYQRIRLPHLADMIGLNESDTETRISNLVSSGSIFAKIDRPAKIVSFHKSQSPEELLTNWSADISELLRLVETTCHLVNKENMVHKVK